MPDIKSLRVDLSQSLVFCVVFVVLAILVALGKIPADKLELVLMMLVPSPIKKDPA